MKYQISEKNGIATALVSGQMTFDDRAEADPLASGLMASAPQRVVVDLSELDYIDSAGLGILLTLREKAQESGAVIAIAGMTGSVKEVLELACFDTLFEFVP